MTSNTSSLPYTEEWITGPHSTSFYTRLYTPSAPKAALVFAHGFVEHVGRYEHVFPHWAAHGIAVFAFDQRGFGRTALDQKRSASSSYGRTDSDTQRGDLHWALADAQKRWSGLPLFLMGHSMVRPATDVTRTRNSCCPGRWPRPLVLHHQSTNKPHGRHRDFSTHSPIETSTQSASCSGQGAWQSPPQPGVPGRSRSSGEDWSVLEKRNLTPFEQDLSRDPSVGKAYNEDPLVVQNGTLK
jgi:alpha-beta hydrolase superfamily lysophospholipase